MEPQKTISINTLKQKPPEWSHNRGPDTEMKPQSGIPVKPLHTEATRMKPHKGIPIKAHKQRPPQ